MGTYSWREICVRFRMDLHTKGALFHGGKFVLSLGWTYTRGRDTYSWREICVRFRMDFHTEGAHIFTEGRLC